MERIKIKRALTRWVGLFFFISGLSFSVCHADDADGGKKQDLNQLFRHSNLPRAHADFSMFHFIPEGDVVTEEPGKSRLLFRTPHGEPDGYAERHGAAVFYYDRNGRIQRIQRLTSEEIDRLNHPY